MARFEPISTYIFSSIVNTIDSLATGKKLTGEKNGRYK